VEKEEPRANSGAQITNAPEVGPRLLFFSGGTALNSLAAELKRHTHNSIHLVTPFDSGGSSAALRAAFNMPAVGDLRSRMMALADDTCAGHPELYRLMTYRLPTELGQQQLRLHLEQISQATDPLSSSLQQPLQGLICHYLESFLQEAPEEFDYRGASLGNLVLTGGYLRDGRSLTPITLLLAELLEMRGIVCPITQQVGQLRVTTESGRTLVGQHLMTGKESPPLGERITEVALEHPPGQIVLLRPAERDLIQSADLLVFPPGSFFSSLIANLLPEGVAGAIASSRAPKVFVPNLGLDPELYGMTLRDQIEVLQRQLGAITEPQSASKIDLLLTDSNLHPEVDSQLICWLKEQGIELLDIDLAGASTDRYDEQKLCQSLLALV